MVSIPGVLDLKAGYSVEIQRADKTSLLRSSALESRAAFRDRTEETPYGAMLVREVCLPFPEEGCELLFRYGKIPGMAGISLQSGVRNTGSDALRFIRTSPLAMSDLPFDHSDHRVFLETLMASSIHHPHGKPLNHLSVNQDPIRLCGETFAHGIGCHAPSNMTFPLGGKFARFQCVVGVDDASSGSVGFEVYCDGKKAFESEEMLSGQASQVIDLDVTGVQEIQLVTTDASDGTNFDWANWADARLTPQNPSMRESSPAAATFVQLSHALSQWWASPMLSQASATSARSMDRVFDPLIFKEAGGLYRAEGKGIFFGPIGRPIGYIIGRIGNAGSQCATLDLDCEMDAVIVQPGEARWGQQVGLFLESPQVASERWIGWVQSSHHARPPKQGMNGWLSWYWLGMNISESKVMEVVDFVSKSGANLRPRVIQIDDGYQRADGQIGLNEKFPSGMQGIAAKIAEKGAMPGLLVNLNQDGEQEVQRLLDSVRHAVANGFRYLKINNFVHLADSEGKLTRLECRRATYRAIREAAGNDTYLLVNTNNGIDRACVGFMDACRVTGSMERHQIASAMDVTLRSLTFNRRWFTVDTDCFYLATDIEKLQPVVGGWPMLRTWMSVTGLSAGNAMTSDPWQWDSMAPFLRHAEIFTPPARERARAIDLGVSSGLSRVVAHVARPWGEWTVALLWNPNKQAQPITLDFARAGMDITRRYAVWSFWDNRFLGVAEKSWTTPVMEASTSQHLCFTPMDDDPMKLLLIGSNLHIWCGAVELERVTSLHGAMEIQLSDAGAKSGDLFIQCASRPQLHSVSGCRVREIASAGDCIWRISLSDRQIGVFQRIELGVEVPMGRQPWFWVVMFLSLSSIAFGFWRYVEKFRLEQQLTRLRQKAALNEERARIARDLHDELGANLARIGLLTELADQVIGDPDKTRHQLSRILTAARGITRQLDSVVWAVDPANDTLESLARYVHGHAEEYMSMASIRCRFVEMDLPEIHLASSLRHHLLMITKESLHNVVKHAGATTVILRLRYENEILTLDIEDDGKGIGDLQSHRYGNGLKNIHKRAAAVGGTCEFTPGNGGKGTLVRLRIPVKSGNLSEKKHL